MRLALFLPLATAAHLGGFALLSGTPPQPYAPQEVPDHPAVTLAALSPGDAALLARWAHQPQVHTTIAPPKSALPRPELPLPGASPEESTALPHPLPRPRAMMAQPQRQSRGFATDTPPAPRLAMRQPAPPRPEPQRERPAVTQQRVPQPAQQQARAAAAAPRVSATEIQHWGRQIRAQIERARPRHAKGTGAVGVSALIAPNGQLLALQITQSSGTATLDDLALDAIRRAGRFTSAPSAQRDAVRFTFTIRFQ